MRFQISCNAYRRGGTLEGLPSGHPLGLPLGLPTGLPLGLPTGYVKVRYPKGMQFDRLSKDYRPSLDATLKGLPEGLPKAP